MAKLSFNKDFYIQENGRFMQGVLLPYGIVTNDTPLITERIGGFGSTGG